MTGKNLILQPGQYLFKQGAASDGMYLVRQGELKVILEPSGSDVVTLAQVGAGAMIGEMALFDQKPRSASVKATTKVEVTQITLDEFQKLTMQIPKWFTSLMSTLSGRLRETNERLQKLESITSGQGSGGGGLLSLKRGLRILNALDLFFNRDGAKDGKVWGLERRSGVEAIRSGFCEEEPMIQKVLTVLIQGQCMGVVKNAYNNDTLTLPNKGQLTKFNKFYATYIDTTPKGALSDASLEVLASLQLVSEKSGYDTFSITLAELQQLPGKWKYQKSWTGEVEALKKLEPHIKITAVDGGIHLKSQKKDIKEIFQFHRMISAIAKAIPAE